MTRKINQAGADLIKSFEGLHDGDPTTPALEPKLCPAGIWTVGWGHALVGPDGKQIKGANNKAAAFAEYNRRWPSGLTRADADILFGQDAAKFEGSVERMCFVPLSDNQFGALVSFAYNAGVGSLAASTLLRKLNAEDYAGAADQFLVWNKATDPNTGKKVELKGLTRRRESERALFLKD